MMHLRLPGVLGLLVLLVINPRVHAQDALSQKLKPLLESHRGEVAVAVKNLQSQESFNYRELVPQPTASLIKLPIMVAAYQQAEKGLVSLDQQITLKQEDFVPGSGILTSHFSPGTVLSLRDALRLMIAYSDNTATNLVLDRIGLPSTNEAMDTLGLTETRIHSLVYRRDTSILPERSHKYGLGSTTAAEIVRLLELLETGKLAKLSYTQSMREHLAACEDKSKIRRQLPASAKFVHKTGAVNKVRCDAGLLETEKGTIAICVLTNENADQSWGEQNEAELLCGEIGKVVFDHFGSDADKSTTPLVSRPLRVGANGPLVEALQRTLNARCSPSPDLSVDGDFGPNTESAVIAFQKQVKLPPDGIVTKETWEQLGPLVSADTPVTDVSINQPNLKEEKSQPDTLTGSPFVTCSSWTIVDAKTGEVLFAQKGTDRREPASTTKIMTAYLACEYAQREPEVLKEMVTFSAKADATPGSTADLRAGEQIHLKDLLYGLLLPSGNDASVAIAEHLGKRLEPNHKGSGYEAFIAAMNRRAIELGLLETHFNNSHGLTSSGHESSSHDLARLAWMALQDQRFSELVNTKSYGCEVSSAIGYKRLVHWQNTNQLLDIAGYDGVKTGTTGSAGACLVSRGHRGGRSLIVVVLGSASSPSRYTDTRNLFRWAWNELGLK